MFIILRKPHSKISLLSMGQRPRVIENIQHGTRNGKCIVIPLDALFCGIFDLWIVEEEGDSVGFVVGVVYGGSPGA